MRIISLYAPLIGKKKVLPRAGRESSPAGIPETYAKSKAES
jgi:hypothetical protein